MSGSCVFSSVIILWSRQEPILCRGRAGRQIVCSHSYGSQEARRMALKASAAKKGVGAPHATSYPHTHTPWVLWSMPSLCICSYHSSHIHIVPIYLCWFCALLVWVLPPSLYLHSHSCCTQFPQDTVGPTRSYHRPLPLPTHTCHTNYYAPCLAGSTALQLTTSRYRAKTARGPFTRFTPTLPVLPHHRTATLLHSSIQLPTVSSLPGWTPRTRARHCIARFQRTFTPRYSRFHRHFTRIYARTQHLHTLHTHCLDSSEHRQQRGTCAAHARTPPLRGWFGWFTVYRWLLPRFCRFFPIAIPTVPRGLRTTTRVRAHTAAHVLNTYLTLFAHVPTRGVPLPRTDSTRTHLLRAGSWRSGPPLPIIDRLFPGRRAGARVHLPGPTHILHTHFF